MNGYMDEEYRTLEPEYDYHPELAHFDNKPKPIAAIKNKFKKLMAMTSATVVVGGYIVSGAMLSDAYTEGSGSDTGGYGSPPIENEIEYPAFLSIEIGLDIFEQDYLDKYEFVRAELVDTPNVTLLASIDERDAKYDAIFKAYLESEIINKYIIPNKSQIDESFKNSTIVYANYSGNEQTYSSDFNTNQEQLIKWFPETVTIKTASKDYNYNLGEVTIAPVFGMVILDNEEQAKEFRDSLYINSKASVIQEYNGQYCVHYMCGYTIHLMKLKDASGDDKPEQKPVTEPTTEPVTEPSTENSSGGNMGSYGDASLSVFYHYNYRNPDYSNDISMYSYIIPDLNGEIEMIWSYEDADVKGSMDNLEYMFLRDKKSDILKYFEDNKVIELRNYVNGLNMNSDDVTDWFDDEIWYAYKGESHKFKVLSAFMTFSVANTTDTNVYTSDTYYLDGATWYANGIEFTIELQKIE